MEFEYEDLIYLARIAEQGERFDEMMDFVKQLLKRCEDIGAQERNLLSVSFKNAVNKRRSSLRILDNFDLKDDRKNMSKDIILKKQRTLIDQELKSICKDAIETVEHLLERTEEVENQVFLLKMKADYFRYMCEYDRTDTKSSLIMRAEEFYKKALKSAESLSEANPIKLGLLLNLTVFYYEVMDERDKACEMARKTLDEGIADLERIPETSHKESSMILQLFRDNLSIWA
jgi:14-3-3 protein epsilon